MTLEDRPVRRWAIATAPSDAARRVRRGLASLGHAVEIYRVLRDADRQAGEMFQTEGHATFEREPANRSKVPSKSGNEPRAEDVPLRTFIESKVPSIWYGNLIRRRFDGDPLDDLRSYGQREDVGRFALQATERSV